MPLYFKTILFFLIYTIPPALIFIGWIDYEYRYHIMAPVIIGVALYSLFQKFDKRSLGMRWDNFLSAAKWQILISVGLTSMTILLLNNGYIRDLEPPQSLWFYLMYLFISGPVQEFTFRAVPFAELEQYEKMPPWLMILIVNLNFAWLHVIYFDWIVYFAAFSIGLIWTSIYYYKRNIWAVSIAHAICGFLAIWFGLV